MKYPLKKKLKKALQTASTLFINGFLTLLPFTLTYSIFSFSFKIIKSLFAPLEVVQSKIPFLRNIPHAEIILAIILILLAGIFLKSIIARSFFNLFETQLNRIPFIRPVYNSAKQLVNAFSPKDSQGFQKVVLVAFPSSTTFTFGFQTGEVPTELAPNVSSEYIGVFIPTSPNPTSGFFIMVKKTDVQVIDIPPQEAMALIISGGIVYPQRYNKTVEQ